MGEIKAASFSFVIFASFLSFRRCFSFFFFLLEFPHVEGGEGQAGTLFLSDARLGVVSVLPSVFLSHFLPLSLLLSPLADSSDKLSLSSAHMALGKNQCPYVSSAALHCTDEG